MTERLSNTKFLTVLDGLPLERIGWEVFVKSERNYTTRIAAVPRFVKMGFTMEENGPGGGAISIDPDDAIFSAPLPSTEVTPLLEQEAVWEFYEDGVWRFEIMAEDVQEDVIPDGGGSRVHVISGRGGLMVLEWAKVLPEGMPAPTSMSRSFTAHPLVVWQTLFAEAQAAGYCDFVHLLFDETVDTAGNAWGAAQEITVQAGENLLELLLKWCEANDLVCQMTRGFRLTVMPSQARLLDQEVVFTLYKGQQKHERKRTRRAIASDVYAVSGDKGIAWASDGASALKWHKRMAWVSAGDATDAAGRSIVANSTLSLLKDEEVTRSVTVPPDGDRRRVFVDYGLGDWIRIEVPEDDAQSGTRRVLALSIEVDESAEPTLELTLQSKFEARQIKIQKMLDALGASSSTASPTTTPITVSQAITATDLEDLRNVDTTGKVTDDLLGWSGTKWVERTPNLALLADVDTTGKASGDALVYNGGTGRWEPAPNGGGGGVLLLENGASVPAPTPVGTLVFEKAVLPAAPTVYDFTLGSLPAGWAKNGAPTETFSGSGMACTFSGGQGYYLDGLSLPTDMVLEAWILTQASVGVMFGPQISGNTGNGAMASWYSAPAAMLVEGMSTYAYNGSFAQTAAAAPTYPTRIRIRKSGTSYWASYSNDAGATWSAESSSIVAGTASTRIGIGSCFGASTATVQRVIYRPGITPVNSGKAKGWWDGSVVQPLT